MMISNNLSKGELSCIAVLSRKQTSKLAAITHFLVLLSFIPGICTAQSWNAVVRAGALWNSRSSSPVTNERSSPLNVFGAVGASRRYGKWEIGSTVGLYSFAFRLKGDFVFGPNPANGQMVTEYHKFTTRVPAVVLMPFLNKHFDTGKFSWYAGIAPAYVSFINPELYEHALLQYKTIGTNGYGLECRIGRSYPLSSGFSIFGEASGGIINMPGFYGRMNMMYLSLALGLRIGVR
jgi:hypothetical protein